MSKQFAFGVKPNVNISRNRFDLSHGKKTTLNVGELVPIDVQEIYPGDTFKTKSALVIRSSSPFVRPVMDNLFADVYYFFVPNRLVYDKWVNVMGENTDGYWANSQNYSVPEVRVPIVTTHSIANELGLPIGEYGNPQEEDDEKKYKVSVLPFRALALIWNEWFRDENLQAPVYIEKGEYNETIENVNNNEFGNLNGYYTGKLPKVNKVHDYFTSALPSPQKGDAVNVPITSGITPVKTYGEDLVNGAQFPLHFRSAVNGSLLINELTTGSYFGYLNPITGGGETYANAFAFTPGETLESGEIVKPSKDGDNITNVYPSNLYVDLEQADVNVNDLRFAFALQKMLERDARSGSRYVEMLASHFNVISPDSRLQRPEYLGGKRMPLTLQQVQQTSQSTEESPLAQVSAYSLSNGICGFSKSFVEHGFVISVACIRYKHTYQQGIEKFWFRKQRTDFYDPVFANIGEQPILSREIYYKANKDDVFGYNEAWADLRYRPSRVSGELESINNNGLDVWHFADYYENQPLLNSQFIQESQIPIDRTLSVESSVANQFIIDVWHKVYAYRALPLYSIPGLVDHH